jgi:hypothetical protein
MFRRDPFEIAKVERRDIAVELSAGGGSTLVKAAGNEPRRLAASPKNEGRHSRPCPRAAIVCGCPRRWCAESVGNPFRNLNQTSDGAEQSAALAEQVGSV